MKLKQFVPREYCARCDVCCRFLDDETPLAPVFLDKKTRLVPHKDGFVCPNFNPAENNCGDYNNRPLDCRIYPFVIMYDRDYKDVLLGIDPKCPFVSEAETLHGGDYRLPVADYQKSLLDALKDIDPRYIARFQDDVKILASLGSDPAKEPVLRELLIGDKPLFDSYAERAEKPLSTYSFIANYVWKDLFEVYWTVIDENFCLFFRTANIIFMPIPPLGRKISKAALKESFSVMDRFNKNKDCSRVEDIAKNYLRFFSDAGYITKEKGSEYICGRGDLADLAGDKYKAKRAPCNHFVKNYDAEYRKFEQGDKGECISLFVKWAGERSGAHKDAYYKALLEDSYHAHKRAMARCRDLGLAGRVVTVNGKIRAYTFGYALDADTFVVLFEVADLGVKGLPQFIFREFCRELTGYRYINIGDDSGLDNIRKTKLSYRPPRVEKQFCAYRARAV